MSGKLISYSITCNGNVIPMQIAHWCPSGVVWGRHVPNGRRRDVQHSISINACRLIFLVSRSHMYSPRSVVVTIIGLVSITMMLSSPDDVDHVDGIWREQGL